MKKPLLSLSAAAALFVSVQAQSVDLEPIVVTSALKTQQSVADSTSTVIVVTAEEIEALHASTVAEVLNRLAGISVVQNGGPGTTQSVLVRGMGTERTLVLIDGVRFQDPSNTSGASFTHLSTLDIERLEIVKGAQSGVWGSDAAAGVINIVTKKPQSGSHAEIGIEAGSYQTKKVSALLTHKSGKNSFKLSASRLLSDGFSAQTPYGDDIDQYEDDRYQNTNIIVGAAHDFTAATSIEAMYHGIDSNSNYDSFTPDDDMRTDYRSRLFSTVLKHRYEEHALRLQYDHTTFERNDFDTPFGVNLFEGKNRNIELRDRIDYMDNGFVNIGVQKEFFTVDYTTVTPTTGHMQTDTTAGYVTNSNRFDAWVLTQALRYDDYSNFDGKTTAKAGVKYFFDDEVSVSANYGTAYNAPNIINILNPWGASNLDLLPETTRSSDLSFTYHDAIFTVFYNKVKNLLEWYDPDGWFGPIGGQYVNGDGESTFKGVELSYEHMIGEELLLAANYTYTSAKNERNQVLLRRPKHQATVNADYYAGKALHIGVSAEYVGTRYDSDDEQGRQTGRYTLWNMVANYDFSDRFDGYVKINNLTDKYYQTVDGYAAAERSFYVGINAKY